MTVPQVTIANAPETNRQAFDWETSKVLIFVALFAGVLGHWLYEVAVAALKAPAGTVFEMPSLVVIGGRVFVSFIAAAFGFYAAYKQVIRTERGFRLVAAFTTGLAVDALTAPWTDPAPTA